MKYIVFIIITFSLLSCGSVNFQGNGKIKKVKVNSFSKNEVFKNKLKDPPAVTPFTTIKMDKETNERVRNQPTQDWKPSETQNNPVVKTDKAKSLKLITTHENNKIMNPTTKSSPQFIHQSKQRMSTKTSNTLFYIGIAVVVFGFIIWFIINPVAASLALRILIAIIGSALLIAVVVGFFMAIIWIFEQLGMR